MPESGDGETVAVSQSSGPESEETAYCPDCGQVVEVENHFSDRTVDRCEMPECGSTDDLKRCRTLDDEPVRACSDCRSDWPRQLRVIEGEA